MQPYYLYGDMPKMQKHKTAVIIDGEALVHNYKLLSSVCPNTRRICVVKADAYGHTAEICVRELLMAGCDFFAVSCIEEALSVRNICRDEKKEADILILGYTECTQAELLAENDIIQTLLSKEYAISLNDAARRSACRIRTHVALDTGMNRIGLPCMSDLDCSLAVDSVKRIFSFEALSLEGLFTHFSRSDEEYDTVISQESHTRLQAERFNKVKTALERDGIRLFCHVCNSAATLRFPEYAFDAVRLGIVLYGVYPSSSFSDIGLRPVMSLRSVISHIHSAPASEGISYGGVYVPDRQRKIATIPIGYADGYIRAYSGAEIIVLTKDGEHKAAVVGRVCMDQCMIDVTDIPASVGDEVVLFGHEPSQLRDLAERAGSIEYECLCLVSARVPRIKKQRYGTADQITVDNSSKLC